ARVSPRLGCPPEDRSRYDERSVTSDGEVREACEALWRESRLATSQASASSTSSAMSQRMALARPAGSRLGHGNLLRRSQRPSSPCHAVWPTTRALRLVPA